MRILLINYGQADNNSAYHILGHARSLAARGHDVCVGVAKSIPEGIYEPRDGFRLASQKTLLKLGARFSDGKPADILHVWTPRESIRRFVGKYRSAWNCGALVLHLEDNEAAIFERFTGRAIEDCVDPEQEWPAGLIHPQRYVPFMESAMGVTIVHRCLEPLVPASLRREELVPIMDLDFFSPASAPDALRRELGISGSTRIIVFNGNDHAATSLDIRQLYETLDRLLERGVDVCLLRTGHVLPANYEGLQFRPGPRCIELGFLDRRRLPDLMRLADVAIQPGGADAFNAHRLPAKVPEYLAMGKPLIMGACNIGGELAEAGAAVVLPKMSPTAMAEAVVALFEDPDAARSLSDRARRFARSRFDGGQVITKLEGFYDRCLRGA